MKRPQMPKWIWQLAPQILTWKEKHVLSFIWWCKDRGCREWNYRLAQRFKCSRRTIKRRLKRLDNLHLIHINFPQTINRTIYRRPYFNVLIWHEKRMAAGKALGGPKMAHINNAKHQYMYKTTYTNAGSQKEPSGKTPDDGHFPSNAGGLGGSREEIGDEKVPETFERGYFWNATTSRMEKVP